MLPDYRKSTLVLLFNALVSISITAALCALAFNFSAMVATTFGVYIISTIYIIGALSGIGSLFFFHKANKADPSDDVKEMKSKFIEMWLSNSKPRVPVKYFINEVRRATYKTEMNIHINTVAIRFMIVSFTIGSLGFTLLYPIVAISSLIMLLSTEDRYKFINQNTSTEERTNAITEVLQHTE